MLIVLIEVFASLLNKFCSYYLFFFLKTCRMETEDHIKKDLSILSVSESLSPLHTIRMFIPMEDMGLNPL